MNHQRENGHVDIANTLMEELMKIHLSGHEWQILMVIFRQTWGYCELKDGEPFRDKNGFWVKKKMDRISHTQFEEFTGINRRKVWNILNNLLRKNIIKKTITKNGDITVCNYGIQKDSSKWRLSPKTVTITKKGDGVSPKTGYGVSPKTVHTKEKNTKETIQKKLSHTFEKCEVVYQLTIYLDGKIRENNEAENRKKKKTEPQIQSWCKYIDKLLRIDKANPDEVKRVIDWVVKDDFWSLNILSADKLRKHYSRIYKRAISKGKSIKQMAEDDPFDWGKAIGEVTDEERNH